MPLNDRKEWRMQPYDLPQVQARILLDVHGTVV